MKKILFTPSPETTMDFNQLRGGEIIAYRMQDSNSYAVLARIKKLDSCDPLYLGAYFAFIPLNTSDSAPRYAADTWRQAIEKASKNKDLFVFDSSERLIEAMHLKTF